VSEQVLPFYLVCDESASMTGAPIDAINQSLPELHEEISTNPVVADKTRFSLIGFSDTAEVILELADLSDVESMPGVAAKATTSYGAAFRLLRQQIEKDVAMLKSDGHRVFRPVVFFLSDGQPTDTDWRDAFAELTEESFSMRPNIVAFGLGDVHEDTVRSVATFRAFVADGSLTPAMALREFASSLTKSIVRSGTSDNREGKMTVVVEEQVPGFTTLEVDPV
jgi:uncharacterized protein YegL